MSTPPTPTTTPIRPSRIAFFLVIAAISIGLAHAVDHPIAQRVFNPRVQSEDWGRMLRVAGYVPTWVIVAIALALIDGARAKSGTLMPPLRDRWTRAVLLALGALFSGALAEACKAIVRRQRPVLVDEQSTYLFRAFSDGPLNTAGLGMPSSHAAVAFGAAFVLCRLHPSAWPVWLLLAAGCGATRVLSRAHFLSDVVAAGFLGFAVAWTLWRLHLANLARGARSERTA